MMKEGIRGLRPSYKQHKQSTLRTSIGGAQAAIEFKIFDQVNQKKSLSQRHTLKQQKYEHRNCLRAGDNCK